MKQQMLKERVELLEIAEWMGYPRMGFGQSNGHKWSVRAGQSEWERFCGHGHVTRIVTVLRNARILRDNGVVPYNPRSAAGTGSSEGQEHRLVKPEGADSPPQVSPVPAADLLADFPEQASVRSAAALRQQRFRDRKRSKA